MPTHYIDGNPLDTDYWWVTDDSGMPDAPSVSVGGVVIPGHHGIIATGGTFDAATYRLVMLFEADTYTQLIDYVGTVKSWFPPHRTAELLFHPEGTLSAGSRIARVRRLAALSPERVTLEHGFWADLELVLEIPSGRWLDATPVSDVLVKPAGVQDWTATLPNWAGGSAPSSDVQVSFAAIGATTDVRVTDVDTGAWLRVAGNIPAGAVVTVDPQTYTASTSSGDISGLLDLGPLPFQLSPSARVRVQQNGSQTVTISGRRAYV